MAIFCQIANYALLSLCINFKKFLPNVFTFSLMKDLLLTFAQKVSLALSRAIHVLIGEDKLNYFKFPS